MNKPTRRELQVALERAGAQLSNAAFDIYNRVDTSVTLDDRKLLDELRRNWNRAYGDIQQINQLTGTPSHEELAASATASEGRIAELTAENELLRGQLQYDLTTDKDFRDDFARLAEGNVDKSTRKLIVKDVMQAIHVYAAAQREAGRLAALAGSATPSVAPVTPKHIEEIKDILLWPVTEDDARAARDMLQSLHFDLSMAESDTLKNADSEKIRDAVRDAIADALGDAYDCTRVWSAWGYGTMSQDDFQLVTDDESRLYELADAAIAAIESNRATLKECGNV